MTQTLKHCDDNLKGLLQAWNQGDDNAMGEIIQIILKPRLIPGVRSMLKRHSQTKNIQPEELISSGWIRWRRFKKRDFQDPEKLITWMLIEIENALKDICRKERRHDKNQSLDFLLSEGEEKHA